MKKSNKIKFWDGVNETYIYLSINEVRAYWKHHNKQYSDPDDFLLYHRIAKQHKNKIFIKP